MSALIRGQARRGALGTLLIVGIVLASLNLSRLPLVGDAGTIEARFAEAGGLRGGDAVMISGAQVGKVREVRLEDGAVTAVLALTDPLMRLGVGQLFGNSTHWNGGRTTRPLKCFPRPSTATGSPGSSDR